jgi:putative nucleotidyltransferase with HDIG domain
VFAELRRIVASEQALRGLQLIDALSATAVVLPELDALRDVEQNRFHHADVHEHTLEVLARTIALTEALAMPAQDDRHSAEQRPASSGEPADDEGRLSAALQSTIGADRAELAALLCEPLADGLTRGEALRWGALLHDAAKPLTRDVRPADGRVTFIGHDEAGAALAREVLGRLRASERLRAHVAALVRHHLRLGFLVHEPQPLCRRAVFGYLRTCEPVEVDVTLLSVADRLATRGDRAQESIDAHLAVARQMLPEALRWRAEGPPAPLLRGDELARELAIATGPQVGELLAALSEAQFAGEIATREQAVEYARALV